MSQKMWVRKVYFGSQGIAMWEVGCQCCGYILFEDRSWAQALHIALAHADIFHWRGIHA